MDNEAQPLLLLILLSPSHVVCSVNQWTCILTFPDKSSPAPTASHTAFSKPCCVARTLPCWALPCHGNPHPYTLKISFIGTIPFAQAAWAPSFERSTQILQIFSAKDCWHPAWNHHYDCLINLEQGKTTMSSPTHGLAESYWRPFTNTWINTSVMGSFHVLKSPAGAPILFIKDDGSVHLIIRLKMLSHLRQQTKLNITEQRVLKQLDI